MAVASGTLGSGEAEKGDGGIGDGATGEGGATNVSCSTGTLSPGPTAAVNGNSCGGKQAVSVHVCADTAPLILRFAGEKWWAWMGTTAFVGVAWLLLFPGLDGMISGRLGVHGLYDEMNERLVALVGDRAPVGAAVPDEPRTVLVDFTADWCTNCKFLEKTVLQDPQIVDAFERDQVVLLKADYTHQPPEIKRLLNVLLSDQVPVIAVFSPDNPNAPIVFLGGYTKTGILDALDKSRPRG